MERKLQYLSVGNVFKRCSSEKIMRRHQRMHKANSMTKVHDSYKDRQSKIMTQLPNIYQVKVSSKLLKNLPILKHRPQIENKILPVFNPIFKRRCKSGGEGFYLNPKLTPKFGGCNL